MRLVLAKSIISAFLCYQTYLLTYEQTSSKAIQKVVMLNIASLQLHNKNTEFLNQYLYLCISCCFLVSVLTVVSKNLLPKIIVIAGIMLWLVFGFHPQLQPQIRFMQKCEYMTVVGGLLFIGGSEYFKKNIGFADIMKPSEASEEAKEGGKEEAKEEAKEEGKKKTKEEGKEDQ